jgi:hypothetical protein
VDAFDVPASAPPTWTGVTASDLGPHAANATSEEVTIAHAHVRTAHTRARDAPIADTRARARTKDEPKDEANVTAAA